MNKSSLLSQLQIDRAAEGPRGPDRPFPWLMVLGAVAALAALPQRVDF